MLSICSSVNIRSGMAGCGVRRKIRIDNAVVDGLFATARKLGTASLARLPGNGPIWRQLAHHIVTSRPASP